MANTIKIKNSGTASAVPASLEYGELGLNYADGKVYYKNSSNEIVALPSKVTISDTAPSSPSAGSVWYESDTGKMFVYHDSFWVEASGSDGATGATGITGATGATGATGIAIQNTAPSSTTILWADTSVTGVGVVPVGGTTGQVLSKGSNTSYDAVWATPVTSSDLALKANIASPTFTGTVTIPAGASISGFAPLANAALTGVPTAPTANAATNTTQIATTAFVTAADAVTTPTGSVIAFAGSSAPTNWLLCYGQAVSRTTYATLFSVISTTYGVGDGTTTFNLPDLRGRTVAGVDNMGGSDAGRLDIANSSGTVVGTQYVTLTSAEMPSHTHTQDSHNHTQNAHDHWVRANSFAGDLQIAMGPLGGDGNKYGIGDSPTDASTSTALLYADSRTATNIATTATNQNTGGGGAHNNMQPTMVLNYIIKV